MLTKIKIALRVPSTHHDDRFFSFRLKQEMHNEPSEFQQPRRIFVISDIEGNFKSFCTLLIKCGVVNKYLKWIFNDGHLVIVGDCLDRGEHVIECLWLIYSLEEQARRKGGYVHFILGNHEIMNLNGDWRYVHPKYATTASSAASPITALYYGNSELWCWLCTKNIIEKIGSILFVHGGIPPLLNELPFSISDINKLAQRHYTVSEQSFTNPLLSIIFNSQDSPFWYRGYYNGTATQAIIDATLKKFSVSTIVTGHTITEQIASYFDGKVINVNTDHANGKSEGLLIERNKYYRITMNNKPQKIK